MQHPLRWLSLLCVSSLFFISVHAQTVSEFIHVDQFGYLPNMQKVAVLSNPLQGYNSTLTYQAPASLSLRRASDEVSVFTAAPSSWNSGNIHVQSGDQGWWFDFSTVTEEGEYYVYDAVNNERSAEFRIANDVYDQVLRNAGRMFYYNRCNDSKSAPYAESNWTDGMNFMNALQDANCRYVYDQNNVSLERDLSGGWFDAGDYNKYVTFAHSAVHDLLWAYRNAPDVFGDDWNIPESGNGLPDILDEIKWELDWLLKMVNPDGSVIIKMGTVGFSDNTSAPPSANVDARVYGPTCTSASISAASMLAHAAEVFGQFPSMSSYALTLENTANSTFDYWLDRRNTNNLETDCDDGTISAGDADRGVQEQYHDAMTAAIHLFALSGDASFATYISDHIGEMNPIVSTFWDTNTDILNLAMLYYTSLGSSDASVNSQIINSLTTVVTNNWNSFYGFLGNDLYRGFIPDWGYNWGSNKTKAAYGSLNQLLVDYNIVPANQASFAQHAEEMVHYFHGVNPLGMVQLSNMEARGAERSINEIYHTWFNDGTDWDNAQTSLYGPAPGFITGGANPAYTINSISPPANQPLMKSYLDFNDGWPNNSWEISEPAIYYQAAYIRLLSSQMSNESLLPVTYSSPLQAFQEEEEVLLRWSVSEEIDADFYEVQYLDDQDDWIALGQVDAINRSNYSFRHRTPRQGPNYYRLRQVDLDGRFSYSNIASANLSTAAPPVLAYPNPVGSQGLELQQIPEGSVIVFHDAQGRRLFQRGNSPASLSLDLASYPAGWYLLSVWNRGDLVFQERILRK